MGLLDNCRALLRRADLDPARSARVFEEYDGKRGYDAYLAACRDACGASIDPPPEDALQQQGFDHFQVLDAGAAADLRQTLDEKFPSSALMRRDYLDRFEIDDPVFTESLLAKLLTAATEQRIKAYFGAEYLVHWFTVIRTLPLPSRRDASYLRSYLWHCDRGPSRHLKLLVYLNDYAEHRGATEFLDLRTTGRFAECGYPFGKPRKRTGDLNRLAKRHGFEAKIEGRQMGAGEGVLFQPARVLHRGVMPSAGPRYVVTLCLLPSPAPWHDALHAGTLSVLGEDSKWHDDARQLLRLMGLHTAAPYPVESEPH